MKSCPKCNRTFPDEGQKFCTFDGGLLIAPQPFDPNATMRATPADVSAMSEKATSRDLPDPNATIAESSFASTVALPRNTAPTGPPTTTGFPQTSAGAVPTPPPPAPPQDSEETVMLKAPVPAAPGPPQAQVQTGPVALPSSVAPPKKKSKLPWIIAGVLLFLLIGAGALAAVFFVVVKPRLEAMQANRQENDNRPIVETNKNTNTNAEATPVTPAPTPQEENYVPPLGSTAFENSNENLDGKLAEHYFDFSFYYPESWQKDPKAGVRGASSFARVERRLPPDFTQESFIVGWYTSAGTYDGDLPNFPRRVEELSTLLSKNYPNYRKVSEGPTMVNTIKGYEFRWVGLSKGTEQGDIQLWGRVIFLPTGKEGDTTGATLTMLSTSLAPELSSVDDVGAKGETPVILDSFRFSKKK